MDGLVPVTSYAHVTLNPMKNLIDLILICS